MGLRPSQWLLPLAVFGVSLFFVYRQPRLWILWALLFIVFEATVFIALFLNRFRLLERYWRRRRFEAMIELCRPVFTRPHLQSIRDIHGVYFAAALVGIGSAEALSEATTIVEKIELRRLAPRFANRYLLVRGQLEICLNQPGRALESLKQATLQQLGMFHLARLFYFFSVAFILSAQELERAYHYAQKAAELYPAEPLYQAQSAVAAIVFKNQKNAEALQTAIDQLPESGCLWERRFFQQYLG